MAKTKSTKTLIEEAVTPIQNIEVKEEVIVQEAKAEPIKKHILTHTMVQMHKKPDLLKASVCGTLTLGRSYDVIDEVKNIYGTFYKLSNGMYVTKSSNYTIF